VGCGNVRPETAANDFATVKKTNRKKKPTNGEDGI
jgi:hypothetical protein